VPVALPVVNEPPVVTPPVVKTPVPVVPVATLELPPVVVPLPLVPVATPELPVVVTPDPPLVTPPLAFPPPLPVEPDPTLDPAPAPTLAVPPNSKPSSSGVRPPQLAETNVTSPQANIQVRAIKLAPAMSLAAYAFTLSLGRPSGSDNSRNV
jgi:hypothetical protein